MASNGSPTPGIKRVVTDQGNKAQRLLRVDQIYSRKDRQVHFVKTAKATPRPDRFGKTALVVRRIISAKGMVADTQIDIKSPHLDRLFKKIFEGVQDLKLNKSPPVAGPLLFYYAAPKLMQIKEEEKEKESPDQSLINDIGTALRFVEEDYGSDIANVQSLLSKGEITFDLLWALLPPLEMIIAMTHEKLRQPQALRVISSDYGVRKNGQKFFYATGQVISHDGDCFGTTNVEVNIEAYEGAQKLTALNFYPLKYHPEETALRNRLIARGKKFVALLKSPACRDYPLHVALVEKEALVLGQERIIERSTVKGRVMVDPVAFQLHNPWSKLNLPYVYASDSIPFEDLTDDDYLECVYWINGFSLAQKQWCRMVVEGMEDIQWNDHAFSMLVLDEDRRQLIHALVQGHRNDATTFDDVIQDKGQGLVGLLSGSPGVGKTLTAEAVAEVTRRPLYLVSAGELGIEADVVDQRLNVILDVTRRWGCVLLIDEAEVFLATRGTDLQRDSLVSVFLRRLEYFMGVCILTTNRKQEIDTAFQSRIHFSIHYPNLDKASRKAIWTNFLNMVGKTAEISKIGPEDIDQLAEYVLNGRQIKNIISCIASLSSQSKEAITAERIKKMIKVLDYTP